LAELRDAIPFDAVERNDLDDQIRRVVDDGAAQPATIGGGDDEDVGWARRSRAARSPRSECPRAGGFRRISRGPPAGWIGAPSVGRSMVSPRRPLPQPSPR
jgi:hypothetical protein